MTIHDSKLLGHPYSTIPQFQLPFHPRSTNPTAIRTTPTRNMTAGQFIDLARSASIVTLSDATDPKGFRNDRSRRREEEPCYDLVPYVPHHSNHKPSDHHLLLLLPPDDTVPHILSYCDARTLSRAACVSRSWRAMAHADELWNDLCKETFGVAAEELRPPPDPTRLLYVWSHERLRDAFRRTAGRGAGWTMTGGRRGEWQRLPVLSEDAFRRFAPGGGRGL